MDRIVLVELGCGRQIVSYFVNNIECKRDHYVIVSADRGFDYGRVVSDVKKMQKEKGESPKGKLIRIATEGDLKQIENNRMKAKEALGTCIRKISDRRLQMQIVNAEYTFDSSKIIFSFTADGRVDFRNLVKDLARVFRVRIELRQIGVRDKAKLINGYGVCGREFCCSSYMREFHPLSIKMAKEQLLPLNPSRISGVCGRIKCCMAYEFQVYKEMCKGLPKMGEKLVLPEGKGRVVDVSAIKRQVYIDLGDGRVIKKSYPIKEDKKKDESE